MKQTFSNATDNFILVQATGYLTDSPSAEQNVPFSLMLTATYGGNNVSTAYSNVVARNGSEQPLMLVSHTDITSGLYMMGYEEEPIQTERHRLFHCT